MRPKEWINNFELVVSSGLLLLLFFHLSKIFWAVSRLSFSSKTARKFSLRNTQNNHFLLFCFFPTGRWGEKCLENFFIQFSFLSLTFNVHSVLFCFVRNRVKVKAGCALITPKSSSIVNRPHPIIAPIPLTKGLRISQMGSHPWNVFFFFLDHSLLFLFDRVLHDYSVAVVGQIVHNCWPADASAHRIRLLLLLPWTVNGNVSLRDLITWKRASRNEKKSREQEIISTR